MLNLIPADLIRFYGGITIDSFNIHLAVAQAVLIYSVS